MKKIKSKTDMAFWGMRSKYCSWWAKRVETPALMAAERAAWDKALAPFTSDQVRDALNVCRQRWQYRPPTADEFAALMAQRAGRPIDPVTRKKIDSPGHTPASRAFFNNIRAKGI